ncbi:hypothetical protein SPHINGOT1_640033 [Sphingomonas sp. T1]|nr:hypothetical protein SPHINGOT1_640033 [Sphingomonas sp. T1]
MLSTICESEGPRKRVKKHLAYVQKSILLAQWLSQSVRRWVARLVAWPPAASGDSSITLPRIILIIYCTM